MSQPYDACIIGSGPAGLASALRLAAHGLRVLLVESGSERLDATTQALSDAEIDTPASHSAMSEAVRRGLGGTSALWGGRCVPLDAVDFEPRPHVPRSGWPIRIDELAPFMAEATRFLGAGDASFTVAGCSQLSTARLPMAEGLDEVDGLSTTELERWSAAPNVWVAHGERVRREPGIEVLTGWTCVGFMQENTGGPVRSAKVARRVGGRIDSKEVRARSFVIACGGVESTRLVLNSATAADGLKPTRVDQVGRFYMGHLSGKLADIQLEGAPKATQWGFERDGGTYVRRRLTFAPSTMAEIGIQNIAFWFDNPSIHDATHGSGVLSAAYLALSAPLLGPMLAPTAIRRRVRGPLPTPWLPHLRNCAAAPLTTLAFSMRFVRERYFRTPRLPGFFTYSPNNRYALHFHAEQAPNAESRITLADACDALGMRRAKVALRWSEPDVESIINAHLELGRRLAQNGKATLHWRFADSERRQAVLDQALDGFHQLGTLRMGSTPADGVTDEFGRLFGTSNLYCATSAVFPTSGQANPTLTMVALTLRQADELARRVRADAMLHAATVVHEASA